MPTWFSQLIHAAAKKNMLTILTCVFRCPINRCVFHRNNCENATSINTFSVRHSDEKPNKKQRSTKLSVQPKNRLHACHGPWAKQTDTTIKLWILACQRTKKKRITCLIQCQIDFKKIVVLQIKMVIGKPDPNILLYWTSDQTKAVRVKTFFHFHFQQVSRQTLHFFWWLFNICWGIGEHMKPQGAQPLHILFQSTVANMNENQTKLNLQMLIGSTQAPALQVKTSYLCKDAIESFGTALFLPNATGCHPQCIEYLICEFSKGCKPVPNLKHRINIQPKPKHGFKSLEQSGVKQQVPTTTTTEPFRRCMQIIQPFHIVAKNVQIIH